VVFWQNNVLDATFFKSRQVLVSFAIFPNLFHKPHHRYHLTMLKLKTLTALRTSVVYAFDANYLMTSHWRTSWVLWHEYTHRLEVNRHTTPVTVYWW